ncbi:MAG: hypothetical protein AABW63_01920 [Nanoarchaeota archaeon]
MTTLEEAVNETENSVSDRGSSWKQRAGKAVLRGAGKAAYFITLKPFEAAYKSVKGRSFDAYGRQVIFILDNYQAFAGDLEKGTALSLVRSGQKITDIFEERPDLFKKRARVLGTKRRPLWRPFGAYTNWYGTDVIRVNLVDRPLNPKERTVVSTFYKMPINFGVDLRLTYQDDPVFYMLAHSGELLQIKKLKGRERKKASDDFRQRIDEEVISFATGTATEHFANTPFEYAIQTPITPSRLSGRRLALQESKGLKITEFDIEKYTFTETQQRIIFETLMMQYAQNSEGGNGLRKFTDVTNSLLGIVNRSNFNREVLGLLKRFNEYRGAGLNSVQGFERASVYDANSGQKPVQDVLSNEFSGAE